MSDMKQVWIFETTSLPEAYQKAASVGGTWLDVSPTAQGGIAIVEASTPVADPHPDLISMHSAALKALFSLAEPIPSAHDGIQILEANTLRTLLQHVNHAIESQHHVVEIRIKRSGSSGAVAFISGSLQSLSRMAQQLPRDFKHTTLELKGEVRRHF